jgi:hypothetical protein
VRLFSLNKKEIDVLERAVFLLFHLDIALRGRQD